MPDDSTDDRTGGSTPGPDLPRVLFVSSHAALGGSEQVLTDLVRCLPRRAVAGVVSLQHGPLVAQLRDHGVEVVVVPTGASPGSQLAGAARLRGLVRRSRPDVVHANGSKAALVAVLAGRRAPVVWMKHDVYRDGRVSRLLARACAAVPSVSQAVARDVEGSGRVRVVHPGVRVDVATARSDGDSLRAELGLTGPVVSVVGRLDPTKGHGELLEVLPALRQAVPGVTALLVGGDDPQHPGWGDALRRRAFELGVADAVVLPGHRPAAAVLSASGALCVPTVPDPAGRGREGFGLVAAEALALGVPVVAHDVGATAEVLAGCGLLVPVGDRAALLAALVQALTDGAERDRLSRCGTARAAELTVERTAEQMLAVYRQAAR